MDDLLTHRLIATLPDCEPTEWNSNKRMSKFSLNSRKPRPVLIEFPSIFSKQKILKISKQLQQICLRLDAWLTELQGALLTLTSKLRKGLQAFLWRLKNLCIVAISRHVFAGKTKQTMLHLLHGSTGQELSFLLQAD